MTDPRRALRSPWWWLALSALVLNDHLLKGSGPAWLTGKLSDFAGMIVAPALLAALLYARWPRAKMACLLAVAVAFAAIKLVPALARAAELGMALAGIPWRIWSDPTDLVAFVALPVAWAVMHEEHEEEPRRWLEYFGMCLGGIACLASAAAPPRPLQAPDGILARAWPELPIQLVDPESGEVIAELPADAAATDAVVHDGVLYSQSHRRLVAVDTRTAEVMFDVTTSERFQAGIEVEEGRVFLIRAGRHRERVVAFDGKRGKELWSHPIPSHEPSRGHELRMVVAAGLVIVPARDALVALDPGSGRQAWQYRAGAALAHAVVSGTSAFAATKNGVIHAVDLQSGQPRWVHDTGAKSGFDGNWDDGTRLGAADGNLFFLRKRRIVAIDAATAGPRWTGPEVDDMVVSGSTVVAQLGDEEQLAAFAAIDGREKWRVEHDDWSATAPVVFETHNLVLVRPVVERLYAYEADDGRLRWRLDLDATAAEAHTSRRVLPSDSVLPPSLRKTRR